MEPLEEEPDRMLSAEAIVELHDRFTHAWHQPMPDALGAVAACTNTFPAEDMNWFGSVAAQHFANFRLWHIEDEARTPGASDAELADVKRRVDTTNQLRNDLAESLDLALLAWLEKKSLPNPNAP